ncbi:hypothetical protein B9Z51_02810 [Limnohabitans sp. T6-5]|uniref:hypothetical protein n=1 Tax=Limnohabitans sp. T6-5 TaxID=1100724 RepID=UPI000D3D2293|nr:hypothetical protein [Limnohabitans sp. T6-5]PUE11258.1 hypothetical protein B9Z51_02810 [Limnohabitans sp. T6-5]
MQASYAEAFQRDMGCTEAEWLGWLPRAVGQHPMQREGSSAHITIGHGRLHLHWQVMPPRAIAQIRLPVLRMHFQFEGINAPERYTFMRHFDLTTQRGGG